MAHRFVKVDRMELSRNPLIYLLINYTLLKMNIPRLEYDQKSLQIHPELEFIGTEFVQQPHEQQPVAEPAIQHNVGPRQASHGSSL